MFTTVWFCSPSQEPFERPTGSLSGPSCNSPGTPHFLAVLPRPRWRRSWAPTRLAHTGDTFFAKSDLRFSTSFHRPGPQLKSATKFESGSSRARGNAPNGAGVPIPRSGNQGPNQSHAQTSGKPALKRLPLESDVVLIKPVASRVVVVLFSFFGHWPKTFSRAPRTENPRESTPDSPRPSR